VLIEESPRSQDRDAAYASDRDSDGYVWNVTRLWGWRADVYRDFAALRSSLMASSSLTDRDWAVLVTAAAAQLGDSYCSLAWGPKLAKLTDSETAAQLIAGEPTPALSEREQVLALWTRRLVVDPNATTADDVARLRAVGLGDREIFEATAFVASRLASPTVNDALGAEPDRQLADAAPDSIRAAVGVGRPAGAEPSRS
jgi:alkylhydroperoxidase family enzyme